MKNKLFILSSLLLISSTSFAQSPKIPQNEAQLIFKTANFAKTKSGWESNCGQGEINTYKDLNGDGLKDAVISDYSTK